MYVCIYVMCVFRVSAESQSDDGYLRLPVGVFVPALLSSVALVVCCLCCCLRSCGCCSCCLATREHQSLLPAVSTAHQTQRKTNNNNNNNNYYYYNYYYYYYYYHHHHHPHRFLLHCALSLAAQCIVIVIGPVCLRVFVGLFVCLFVGLLPSR